MSKNYKFSLRLLTELTTPSLRTIKIINVKIMTIRVIMTKVAESSFSFFSFNRNNVIILFLTSFDLCFVEFELI